MTMLLIFLVIVPWSIYRQTKVHVVTHGGVLKMPIIFAAVGVFGFGTGSLDGGFGVVSYLALSALLSIGLGVWRGLVIPLWRNEDGFYVSQGNRTTILLWVLLISSKVVMGTIAGFTGWFPGENPGDIFLFIAVSFLAQNLVVAQRAGGWDSLPRDSDLERASASGAQGARV